MDDSQLVFDKKQAMDRVCEDAALLIELVGIFFEECERQLPILHSALSSKEAKTFERTSHSLKGASGNVGAMKVWQLAAKMEKLGLAGNLEEGARCLKELEVQVEEFRKTFDEEKARGLA